MEDIMRSISFRRNGGTLAQNMLRKSIELVGNEVRAMAYIKDAEGKYGWVEAKESRKSRPGMTRYYVCEVSCGIVESRLTDAHRELDEMSETLEGAIATETPELVPGCVFVSVNEYEMHKRIAERVGQEQRFAELLSALKPGTVLMGFKNGRVRLFRVTEFDGVHVDVTEVEPVFDRVEHGYEYYRDGADSVYEFHSDIEEYVTGEGLPVDGTYVGLYDEADCRTAFIDTAFDN